MKYVVDVSVAVIPCLWFLSDVVFEFVPRNGDVDAHFVVNDVVYLHLFRCCYAL